MQFPTRLLSAFFLLFLAGCGTAPDKSAVPVDPQAGHAARLFEQQQYQSAAELYLGLAARSAGESRALYQLLAADSLLHDDQHDKAETLLQQIDRTLLPADRQIRFRLLQAELALARQQPGEALSLLEAAPVELSPDQRLRLHSIHSRAYRVLEQPLEEASELINLDRLLDDDQQRLTAQTRLLAILAHYPPESLQKAFPDPSPLTQGWIELAGLVRGFPNDPQGVIAPWREWQDLFPDHPAAAGLLTYYYEQQQQLTPSEIRRIAVLLPHSGKYAPAAQAIRDGLMSAWYADNSEQRPELVFYDTSNPDQTWPLLHQAADEGADMVIGPLAKPAVLQLARAGGLPLPALALNRVVTDTAPPENFYQYSLSPEDEAHQAALWAAYQGWSLPGLLYPDTPFGLRIARAFEAQWRAISTQPIQARSFDPAAADFSTPVAQLLGMDRAKAEHKRQEREAGKKLEFSPPPLPVDFFFVVGNKTELRQLRPMLQFHYAGQLPVLSLSRTWQGALERDEAFDLAGIQVAEIPWLVEPHAPEDPLSRQTMNSLFPHSSSRYPRLLPMGIDAYRVLPQLRRLSTAGQPPFEGATGLLYLNERRHLLRRLTWVSLALEPEILGITPPADAIDTLHWEQIEAFPENSQADESPTPEKR